MIRQVLTGDNLPVAKRVCEELEIPSAVCVLGSQLALLEDDDFAAVVEQASVFAKVFPPNLAYYKLAVDQEKSSELYFDCLYTLGDSKDFHILCVGVSVAC